MTTVKWNDLSYEGRYIRRAFKLVLKKLHQIEKQGKTNENFIPNLDELNKIIRMLTMSARANTEIVKTVDIDQRLSDIEKLIKNMTPEELASLKVRNGN